VFFDTKFDFFVFVLLSPYYSIIFLNEFCSTFYKSGLNEFCCTFYKSIFAPLFIKVDFALLFLKVEKVD
jgi:hypothetical protein